MLHYKVKINVGNAHLKNVCILGEVYFELVTDLCIQNDAREMPLSVCSGDFTSNMNFKSLLF